jgi:transcription initiation factor TFIID subunit 1
MSSISYLPSAQPSSKGAPDYHTFVPKSSIIILPEVQKKAKAGRYLSLEQFRCWLPWHCCGAFMRLLTISFTPLSMTICRADLQQLYRNAVAYNSPGVGGAFGAPCAHGKRAGTECAWEEGGTEWAGGCIGSFGGSLCMWAVIASRGNLTSFTTFCPPRSHVCALLADFIDLASRLLQDSERLIAEHMGEIQAAEVGRLQAGIAMCTTALQATKPLIVVACRLQQQVEAGDKLG